MVHTNVPLKFLVKNYTSYKLDSKWFRLVFDKCILGIRYNGGNELAKCIRLVRKWVGLKASE